MNMAHSYKDVTQADAFVPVTHPPPWKYTSTGSSVSDNVSGVYHLKGTLLASVVVTSSAFLMPNSFFPLQNHQCK